MKTYFCILVLLIASHCVTSISYNSLLSQRFNFKFKAISNEEIFELIKTNEYEKRLRLKQEKESKIYSQHLASRIRGSILRDFLTMRYSNWKKKRYRGCLQFLNHSNMVKTTFKCSFSVFSSVKNKYSIWFI